MIGWSVAADAGFPGRCFQARNAALVRRLIETGRLQDDPEITYEQIAVPSASRGPFLVAQAVTYVSPAVVRKGWITPPELEVTERWCADADLVIAHYPLHADCLIGLGIPAAKIEIVNPTSALPRLDREGGPPRRPHTVGFAGQLRDFKRPDLARAAAEFAGAEFRIAHNRMPEQMPDFYDGLGVLAFPSLCESAGVVIHEAISRGVPVVATRAAGAAVEIERTGAGIVVGPSEEEFAEAVAEVLDNPAYAELAWEATVRTVDEWINELIEVCEQAHSRRAA